MSFWKTGVFMQPKNDRASRNKNSFSGDMYAGRAQIYIDLVDKINSRQWHKLVDALTEAYDTLVAEKSGESDTDIDRTGDDEYGHCEALQASDLVALDEDSD